MFYVVNDIKEWIIPIDIVLIDTADTLPIFANIVKVFGRAFTMLDNFTLITNNSLLSLQVCILNNARKFLFSIAD